MSRPRKKRDKSLSSFGKSQFERDIMQTREEDLDSILKQVHTIENEKYKQSQAPPGVIERLLGNEERIRLRSSNSNRSQVRKKSRVIRQVKKVDNPLDNIPSAAHYSPKFDSVLKKNPKHRFQMSEFNQISTSEFENLTMGEMLYQWNRQIRRINFQNPTKEDIDNHYINKTRLNNQVTEYADVQYNTIPDRKTCRTPVTAPPPPKPESKIPGIISAPAIRDSYFKREVSPGPSDYQSTTIFSQNMKKVTDFSTQASRPPTEENRSYAIRDVRKDIDSTKPRTQQCIPFDKQSSREPQKKNKDAIWKEIEAEQERIIESLAKPEVKPKAKKKAIEPFALQTPNPEHPFGHLMRKETEPSQFLDVEGNLKHLDRPVTAFSIAAPAQSSDRMVYRISDAPDVMYDHVMDDFKNTVPRATTPVEIARYPTRHSPYYYMPKPCGQGPYNPAGTSFDNKRSVNMFKMADRQLMLDSPSSLRKKVATGIPPPIVQYI